MSVVIVLVAALPSVLAADWGRWERHMAMAQGAFDQGRDASAEYWFKAALREADLIDPLDARAGQSLRKLLVIYRKQERQREITETERRLATLPAPRAIVEITSPDVIAALTAYANLLTEARQEARARVVAARAAQLRQLSPGSPETIVLNFNPVAELREYAQLLRDRGRDPEAHAVLLLAGAVAERFVQRYASLRQRLAGPSALPSLTHLELMRAGFEALEGRLYPEAEGFFADALKIAGTFSTGDVTAAHTRSALAYAYAGQRKTAEFHQAAAIVLPVFERTGAGHGLVAPGLRMLALAYLNFAFDPAAAKAHMTRALALMQRDLDSEHPTIGLHLAGRAASTLALEGAAPAKADLDRALVIAQKQYSRDHLHLASALMKVVDVAIERGEYPLAHEVAGRTVNILTRMLDPRHPDVLRVTEYQTVLRQKMQASTETVALSKATSIPVEISGNTTYVSALINGKQRAVLIVDTGATTTLIRPMVFARLGYVIPADAPRRKAYVVGGTTVEVVLVTLASLQVGDAVVENIQISVGETMPGADIDGLLGADFLQRFRMTIDKPTRRMVLEPAGK